jgi:hypothetical protein
MSDEAATELDLHAITITMMNDDTVEVDLGDVPPLIAAAVFRRAADQCDDCTPNVRLTYDGNVIWEPDLDDDDDEAA